MDLLTELQRGEQARQVLESEIYAESWQAVRDGIISAWESAPIRDKEGANELKLMLKLLTDVRRNVETVMQTGKMAKIQIERESLLDKAKRKFK
ncbi:MAG: hypothetical protein ACYCZJ_13265 [Sulfuriferula sp.]